MEKIMDRARFAVLDAIPWLLLEKTVKANTANKSSITSVAINRGTSSRLK